MSVFAGSFRICEWLFGPGVFIKWFSITQKHCIPDSIGEVLGTFFFASSRFQNSCEFETFLMKFFNEYFSRHIYFTNYFCNLTVLHSIWLCPKPFKIRYKKKPFCNKIVLRKIYFFYLKKNKKVCRHITCIKLLFIFAFNVVF